MVRRLFQDDRVGLIDQVAGSIPSEFDPVWTVGAKSEREIKHVLQSCEATRAVIR